MQARKRSFFEEFTVAFAKPALWEKCRELSRILPLASPNELHVVFPQICGDVFGYGAGGMFNNWIKVKQEWRMDGALIARLLTSNMVS